MLLNPHRQAVRPADRREVVRHVGERTKSLPNERAAHFPDVRENTAVDVLFDLAGNRNLASSVNIAAAEEQAAEHVDGPVVRGVGPDSQIVRTTSRKEVIVPVEERTTFAVNGGAARQADFRPGVPVRVQFDVRNRKTMAHSVAAMPNR